MFRSAVCQAIGIVTLCAAPLAAGELPRPEDKIVLEVSGAISQVNLDDTALFDMDMLRALDAVTIRTHTIWTQGDQAFTGVELHTLLDHLGAEGSVVRATAANDYAAEIPAEDWVPGGPIVAYLANGKPMSLRDKGPLWIVYPYDDDPAWQTEVTYARSVWQLDRLLVE